MHVIAVLQTLAQNKNLVVSNESIKPNFCFDLSHRRSTTVSLETRNLFDPKCLEGRQRIEIAHRSG